MPTDISFSGAQKRGAVGERFIMEHLDALVSADFLLNLRDTSGLHVAGMDATGQLITLGETVERTVPDWVTDDLPNVSQGRSITSWISGGIEDKTVHHFLTRTDDNELPCGTLGFELWQDTARQHPGWLIHYLDPVKRNQAVEAGQGRTKAVQPMLLAYLLCSGDDVYAAVLFEHTGELLDYLWAKAAQAGVDPAGLPTGEAAQSFQPEGLMIRGKMWLIPLEEIAGFATVTMIGDMPFLRPDIILHQIRCSTATQGQRYDYLCALAGDRRMPYDESYRHCFTPKPSEQVFADAIYDLSVIRAIDASVYPSLGHLAKRTTVIAHLEGLLLNILSHPYALWPRDAARYFPIGKDMLEAWCKDHGIGGSTMSWQGHLIFLEDCGLTHTFRAIGSSDDPILQSTLDYAAANGQPSAVTFRTVPRYTEEILRHADEVAAVYLRNRVNLSHLTKADVIAVRGNETADRLYRDRRIISAEEQRVREKWQRVLIEMVGTHGYALRETVIRMVRRAVPRTKPYRDALRKLETLTPFLANQAGCEYHPIRKADRERYQISKRIKCWIITRREG